LGLQLMSESIFDRMQPVVDELRVMGVRVTFHAAAGSIGAYCRMHGRSEWTPEFSRQVAEVFARHGLREGREGLWVSAGADEKSIGELEKTMRADDEYRHIHETIAKHPDWSDDEVAAECGVQADYVAELRDLRDR
jgi:hypothetical protein